MVAPTFREPIQLDLAWWVALPPGKISIWFNSLNISFHYLVHQSIRLCWWCYMNLGSRGFASPGLGVVKTFRQQQHHNYHHVHWQQQQKQQQCYVYEPWLKRLCKSRSRCCEDATSQVPGKVTTQKVLLVSIFSNFFWWNISIFLKKRSHKSTTQIYQSWSKSRNSNSH